MRKTRQRDSDAPGPHSPWDETAPGPWMGGHYWTDPDGELRPAVVGDEFDLVISLFTRTGHGPGPRAEHVVAPVPDAALDAHQLHTVQRLARTAGLALDADLTTLVRCHSGYNRSGLVVAQFLVDRGLVPPRPLRAYAAGAPRRPCTTRSSPPTPPPDRTSRRCSSGSTPDVLLGARSPQVGRTVMPLSPSVVAPAAEVHGCVRSKGPPSTGSEPGYGPSPPGGAPSESAGPPAVRHCPRTAGPPRRGAAREPPTGGHP
ncbi:hypothetical protein [Streptomyces sp. NBC_01232]|uniref:hypothetical protein n=1 Tax=Streptomyces sp. NBC_01232 TaxID=2903786 RepID=UPI002E1506B4